MQACELTITGIAHSARSIHPAAVSLNLLYHPRKAAVSASSWAADSALQRRQSTRSRAPTKLASSSRPKCIGCFSPLSAKFRSCKIKTVLRAVPVAGVEVAIYLGVRAGKVPPAHELPREERAAPPPAATGVARREPTPRYGVHEARAVGEEDLEVLARADGGGHRLLHVRKRARGRHMVDAEAVRLGGGAHRRLRAAGRAFVDADELQMAMISSARMECQISAQRAERSAQTRKLLLNRQAA